MTPTLADDMAADLRLAVLEHLQGEHGTVPLSDRLATDLIAQRLVGLGWTKAPQLPPGLQRLSTVGNGVFDMANGLPPAHTAGNSQGGVPE